VRGKTEKDKKTVCTNIRERERGRERKRERGRERESVCECVCVCGERERECGYEGIQREKKNLNRDEKKEKLEDRFEESTYTNEIFFPLNFVLMENR
jgi:hypothetical protein